MTATWFDAVVDGFEEAATQRPDTQHVEVVGGDGPSDDADLAAVVGAIDGERDRVRRGGNTGEDVVIGSIVFEVGIGDLIDAVTDGTGIDGDKTSGVGGRQPSIGRRTTESRD